MQAQNLDGKMMVNGQGTSEIYECAELTYELYWFTG